MTSWSLCQHKGLLVTDKEYIYSHCMLIDRVPGIRDWNTKSGFSRFHMPSTLCNLLLFRKRNIKANTHFLPRVRFLSSLEGLAHYCICPGWRALEVHQKSAHIGLHSADSTTAPLSFAAHHSSQGCCIENTKEAWPGWQLAQLSIVLVFFKWQL